MAVTAKVLSGSLSATNGGTTDFTSSGFGTPDAAIVYLSQAYTAGNPATDYRISVGVWDGTSQYVVAAASTDNLATMATCRGQRTDAVAESIISSTGGGAVTVGAAYAASNITDGIRLTMIVDNTSASRYATVILLKGVTNKKAGILALSGSSALDVTAPGFKPDLVFFGSVGNAVTTTGTANASILSFGVAHNSSADTVSQGCVMYASSDNVADAVVNHAIRNDGAMGQIAGDSTTWVGSIGTFDANGFTVTPSADSGNDAFIYLALELPDPDDAFVGIVDSKTSTGTQAYTGTGFTPVVLGLASCLDTAVNTLATSAYGSLSLGATDGTVQQCLIVGDEDAASTSNSYSRADLSNVLNLRFDDDTVDAVAAYSSFDSDGFTLNYSDGSASARKMLVWAIGDSTAGGSTTHSYSGSGSITFSGTATTTWNQIYGYSGSGSLAFSGSASTAWTSNWTYSGSGTLTFSGTGTTSYTPAGSTTYTYAGSGSLAFSGAATTTWTSLWSYAGSGEQLFFGAGTTSYTPGLVVYSYAGSGSIAFSGAATTSGPIVVTEQRVGLGGYQAKQGKSRSVKKQKVILIERVEDVEDLVEQIEEVVREEPKVKPLLRKAKKQKPETVENTTDNAQAWIDYYQAVASALQNQEKARQVEEALQRGVVMLNAMMERQETAKLMAVEKRRKDEEDFLLILMAA